MGHEAESELLRQFCRDLRLMWIQAGGPTLQTQGKAVRLSKSQVGAILNGGIRRLPDWDVVQGLVQCLRQYARQHGRTESVSLRTGIEEFWRPRYDLIQHAFALAKQTRRSVAAQISAERTPSAVAAGHNSSASGKSRLAGSNRRQRVQERHGYLPDADPGPQAREPHATVLHGEASLDLPPPQGAPPRILTPAQLPRDITDFTGRQEQVDSVTAWLTSRSDPGTTPAVAICAVAGMGGIGKTTLAVHVAHRCVAAFPDGQLYVNLRDPDPYGDPVDPAQALEGFLFALGADVGAIPAGLRRRVDAYRSRLAGRRVLVVLDNATSEGQVRPLLPASLGCAALVTSRVPLAGLEGVKFIDLDVLGSNEATTLLSRIVGQRRVSAEPQAAEEIIRWCDRIPLALRIAGARFATRPHWPLARLAKAMGDERCRLDELTAGDLAVRACIALSYADLPEATRQAFRMLGVLDTAEVVASLLAAALDTDVGQASKHIEALVDARLVNPEQVDGGSCRYCCHDLVHLFARERAEAEDNAAIRLAAISRVQSTWAAGLAGAAMLSRQPIRFDRVTAIPRSALDDLADAEKAQAYDQLARFHMAIYQSERALHAAMTALDVAERLGLKEVTANAWVTIHTVRYFGGAGNALAELQAAAEIYRDQGPPRALQRATANIGYMLCQEGDYAAAQRVRAGAARDDPGLRNPLFDSLRAASGAMFTGDWNRLLSAVDYIASEAAPAWQMHTRCTRAWIRILRGQAHGESLEAELRTILAAARQSGWLVIEWTALAHIAFCRALQRRPHDVCALLSELVESWQRVRAFVSSEWITPAAHAAALSGRTASALLHDLLSNPPRVTTWIRAARHTVAGGLAAADGHHQQAATEHLAAAHLYAQIPDLTDHILAMASALAILNPDDPRTTDVGHAVQAFADRAHAPGLLDNSVFGSRRILLV